MLLVIYKSKKYVFESERKLQAFLAAPAKYNEAELPVKMPPSKDPISLAEMQGY